MIVDETTFHLHQDYYIGEGGREGGAGGRREGERREEGGEREEEGEILL